MPFKTLPQNVVSTRQTFKDTWTVVVTPDDHNNDPRAAQVWLHPMIGNTIAKERHPPPSLFTVFSPLLSSIIDIKSPSADTF